MRTQLSFKGTTKALKRSQRPNQICMIMKSNFLSCPSSTSPLFLSTAAAAVGNGSLKTVTFYTNLHNKRVQLCTIVCD